MACLVGETEPNLTIITIIGLGSARSNHLNGAARLSPFPPPPGLEETPPQALLETPPEVKQIRYAIRLHTSVKSRAVRCGCRNMYE